MMFDDLSERFRRARMAAVRTYVQNDSDDEFVLLKALPDQNKDQALRLVFDNSRRLGQSFVKHSGLVFDPSDFRDVLPKLGITCMTGQWYQRDNAIVRENSGCLAGLRMGSFVCDYFREAIDGLTLGISEDVLFARHASCRHGDDRCLDVWFTEESESSRKQSKGALPQWAFEKLSALANKLAVEGIQVSFDGLAEGTLYCQITSTKKRACTDQVSYESLVAREIAQFWPGVRIKNVTPTAVYGDGF